jgi:hypothetical protein
MNIIKKIIINFLIFFVGFGIVGSLYIISFTKVITRVIKNNLYISKKKSNIFNKLNIFLKKISSEWIKELSYLNKDNNKISLNLKYDFNYFYESNRNSLTKHNNHHLSKYENWNTKIETPFWLSVYIFFFLIALFFFFYYLNFYSSTSIKQLIDYLLTTDITKNEVINEINKYNTKYSHILLSYEKNYQNTYNKNKYLIDNNLMRKKDINRTDSFLNYKYDKHSYKSHAVEHFFQFNINNDINNMYNTNIVKQSLGFYGSELSLFSTFLYKGLLIGDFSFYTATISFLIKDYYMRIPAGPTISLYNNNTFNSLYGYYVNLKGRDNLFDEISSLYSNFFTSAKQNREEALKLLNSNYQHSDLVTISTLGTYLDTDDREYQVKNMNRFNFFLNKCNNITDLNNIINLIHYLEMFITYYMNEKMFENYVSKINRNTTKSASSDFFRASSNNHNNILSNHSKLSFIYNEFILNSEIIDNRNPLYRSLTLRFDGGLSFLIRLHCQLITLLIYKISILEDNKEIIINDPLLLRLERHIIFILELINNDNKLNLEKKNTIPIGIDLLKEDQKIVLEKDLYENKNIKKKIFYLENK